MWLSPGILPQARIFSMESGCPTPQGEDVVAGIRTPLPLNKATKTGEAASLPSLEEAMPELYQQLDTIQRKLETYFRDMQDIEFTIQDSTLWMLQTRTGKRNGTAAIRMAVDMCKEGLISKEGGPAESSTIPAG